MKKYSLLLATIAFAMSAAIAAPAYALGKTPQYAYTRAALEAPEVLTAHCNVEGAEVISQSAEESPLGMSNIIVKATVPEGQSATITIDVPEGWTSLAIQDPFYGAGNPDVGPLTHIPADESEMIPTSMVTALGFKLGNSISLPVSDEEFEIMICLVDHDNAYMGMQYRLEATITEGEGDIIVTPPTEPGEPTEPSEPVALDTPDTLTATCNIEGAELKFETEEENSFGMSTIFLKAEVAKGEEAVVTFTVPEGWSNLAIETPFMENDPDINPLTRAAVSEEEDAWMPAEFAYTMGMTLTDSIKLPASDETYELRICLVDNNRIYKDKMYVLEATISEKTSTGINTVNAAEGLPTFYTLEGIKVINPDKGVYIRIANGRVSKVIL
ncbi:MAG: hypothetical protein K2H35_03910 [Muribaculaceae bacterium]|nr:hypothetical protein [Muribaculaceae bacterium]